MLALDDARTLEDAWARIAPLAQRFDVFHFHARSFLANWPDAAYPAGLDIALLKLTGRKVFFHFRGQEARLASEFAAKNAYHYVDDASGYLFRKMPDATKVRLRDYITGLCDGVFVTDPELQSYVPGARIVPRALDGSTIPYVGVSDSKCPVVVHAPSRRGVKGTEALIAACRQLEAEGHVFELRLVENMPHSRAIEAYRDASIIVDQLRIGWYGVLAVEAMALGKPVIAHIRPDLLSDGLPVVDANPHTIGAVLKGLLNDFDRRQHLSRAGRTYFEQTHECVTVARNLAELYSAPSTLVDPSGLARLLDYERVVSTPAIAGGETASRIRHFFDIARSEGMGNAIALARRFVARQLWKR